VSSAKRAPRAQSFLLCHPCRQNVVVFDGASKQEKVVTKACIAVLLMLMAVFPASVVSAQQPQEQSDADKAKAMLLRASIAVKADKDTALRKFTAGEDGFRDRDIYPYCFTLKDGVVVTGQTRGNDIRTLKDSTGKVFGQEIFDAAQKPEGEVTEIRYLPGADRTPVAKVSFVTRVGELGCGVGYYP
jgi:Single Cache domain 2